MTVPVVVAVGTASHEAALVAALAEESRVAVVRRCVDVAELLATAAAGIVRVAIVSADVRRLDREVVSRLRAADVGTVGLATCDDEERALYQLGVDRVTGPFATADDVINGVLAVAEGFDSDKAAEEPPSADEPMRNGRLVAVWGPTGAPGRTTVAISLAAEFAALESQTLLVDADVYGGVVAQMLGVVDDVPGLPAAARDANVGSLDVARLVAHARQVASGLTLLSGIPRANRWPEIRPAALESVFELARRAADYVVVDCGFDLATDEELSYDTAAPQRNAATLVTVECADAVVVVGAADAVSMQRLIRALSDLRELNLAAAPIVVVNKVRAGLAAAEQVRAALSRFAGVDDAYVLPYDLAALDAALRQGASLADVAPNSELRLGVRTLAAHIADVELPVQPRRWFRFRRSG